MAGQPRLGEPHEGVLDTEHQIGRLIAGDPDSLPDGSVIRLDFQENPHERSDLRVRRREAPARAVSKRSW